MNVTTAIQSHYHIRHVQHNMCHKHYRLLVELMIRPACAFSSSTKFNLFFFTLISDAAVISYWLLFIFSEHFQWQNWQRKQYKTKSDLLYYYVWQNKHFTTAGYTRYKLNIFYRLLFSLPLIASCWFYTQLRYSTFDMWYSWKFKRHCRNPSPLDLSNSVTLLFSIVCVLQPF